MINIVYKELEVKPDDKMFENVLTGQIELCHSTGYKACDRHMNQQDPSNWWNEYIDSSGSLHYGR